MNLIDELAMVNDDHYCYYHFYEHQVILNLQPNYGYVIGMMLPVVKAYDYMKDKYYRLHIIIWNEVFFCLFYLEFSLRRFCVVDDDCWRLLCPLLLFSSARLTLERDRERGSGSGDIDRSELIFSLMSMLIQSYLNLKKKEKSSSRIAYQ